jgi:hypothetical protein
MEDAGISGYETWELLLVRAVEDILASSGHSAVAIFLCSQNMRSALSS